MRQELEDWFSRKLDVIPTVNFTPADEIYPIRSLRDLPEIKFTNITQRTNPLSLASYVAIDIETTGVVRTSRIIEISAIRFDAGEPIEKFETLVDPECPIPPEATAVNHITDEMVVGAPKYWQVIPALQDFIGSSSVVGHNLAFDLQFLYTHGLGNL